MNDETAKYGFLAVAAYVGYKAMSGAASTATAPFRFGANAVEGVGGFAEDTAGGIFDFGGNVAGGVVDTADNTGGFVGDIATGVTGTAADGADFVFGGTADAISAPGNVARDIYGGASETVDNLNPFA